MDTCENNLIDYQLIYFINYLIGTEYIESLGYFLKEKDIVKNTSTSIEYFYDFSANINIQLIMIHYYEFYINILNLFKYFNFDF